MTSQKARMLLASSCFALLAFSPLSASARIICNMDGDCWHEAEEYTYQPEWRLTIHPNDWKWKEGEHYTWREHKGRGYWKGGEWEAF
jgi:hypothetical protein